MGTRRNSNGRLNMDIVREDDREESVVLPLGDENVPHQRPSSQYTAEWLERVEFSQTARSLSQEQGVGSSIKDHFPRVSKSAPALSVKSRRSASEMSRGKLQLQLQQLKKRQALEKETREVELEIKRWELELEREKRLAELAERKALQELEDQLAEAKLVEQLEVDWDDQYLGSDDGNEDIQDRREAERREAEQREAERRDVDRREAERCETERRDAEQRSAEQREREHGEEMNNSFGPNMDTLSIRLLHDMRHEHHAINADHSLPTRNIWIIDFKTMPKERMLVNEFRARNVLQWSE